MSVTVAKIAVENTAFSFDDAFDYAVPDSLSSQLKAGSLVLVPFGRSNQKRQGFVFAVRQEQQTATLKSVSAVLSTAPLLNNELLRIAVYLKENTFCTLYDAAKAMLPSGMGVKIISSFVLSPDYEKLETESLNADEKRIIEYLSDKSVYLSEEKILKDLGFEKDFPIVRSLEKKGYLLSNTDSVRKIGDSTVKMVSLSGLYIESENKPKLTKKQQTVIKLLEDIGTASVKEICYFTGVTSAVISALFKKGIVNLYDNKVYRRPKFKKNSINNHEILLTEVQNSAYNNIKTQLLSEKPEAALLYGVTGSGKTSVYMKLVDKAVNEGKSVIVMVPEISLTPQMLDLFYERYGERVAVMHSGLSMGERKDEWERINNGEADIVLGTRSAVFAPVENLGLIVIDEEQEQSYKSEMTPRYNAKDVALYRAKLNKALVVFASATPSVVTYAKAKSGIYSLNCLNERYGSAQLPQVITGQLHPSGNENHSNLTKELYDGIKDNLENKKQTILLLNRRGFNTFAVCSECGEVKLCPHCSISLTYHTKNHRLMCHYCGYSEPFNNICNSCSKPSVTFSGSGTQRLEDEIKDKFPEARILRLDTDSASTRYYFEEQLEKFSRGEYDILLGTQMVAKGLDFPNVTLVGVVSVDQQLFNDDYKSSERTFDLLTQVVGRSGRGEEKGKAVIQTSFPDNEIIQLACKQDYEAFFNLEIKIRKALVYPPYCDFCSVGFMGEDEIATRSASRKFFENLKALHSKEYSDLELILLNPITPRISKMAGKYRYRVIIKCKNTKRFREFISRLLKEFSGEKEYKKINVFADINPESMF